MRKYIPLNVMLLAALSGCSLLKTTMPGPGPERNSRVVERDLKLVVPGKSLAARTVSRSLVADERLPVNVRKALERGDAAGPQPAVKPVVDKVEPAAKKWDVLVSDVRLAATFERWAKEASAIPKEGEYRILWDADKHVLIDATPSYSGSLLDAIEASLATPSIRKSSYPLEACLYSNNPPIIRITKLGEQAEACPEYK